MDGCVFGPDALAGLTCLQSGGEWSGDAVESWEMGVRESGVVEQFVGGHR